MLRLETSLQSFVDTDTRQLAAVECIVPGTKGAVEGTARFPFVLPLPRPLSSAVHGSTVARAPVPTLRGVSMAVTHGLAVVVRRPWYTFDITRYFPLRVESRGAALLREWRGLEARVIARVIEASIRRKQRSRRSSRSGSREGRNGDRDSSVDDTSVSLTLDDVRELPNVVLVDDCGGGVVALDMETCARGTQGSFRASVAVREQPREQPIVCLRLRVWQEEACDDIVREALVLDEVLFDAWGRKRSLLLSRDDADAIGPGTGGSELEDSGMEDEDRDDGGAGPGEGDGEDAGGESSSQPKSAGRLSRPPRQRGFNPMHGTKEFTFGFPLEMLGLLPTVIYKPPRRLRGDSDADFDAAAAAGADHRMGRGLVGGTPVDLDESEQEEGEESGTIDGTVTAHHHTAIEVPHTDVVGGHYEGETGRAGAGQVGAQAAAGSGAIVSAGTQAAAPSGTGPSSSLEDTVTSQTVSLQGDPGNSGEEEAESREEVGSGAGPAAGAGGGAGAGASRPVHIDDPDEEVKEFEEELAADLQEELGLDACSFSVRTYARLDVYCWKAPKEERQRMSRWRRQRRRLVAITKGLEEGDPEAAVRLLRQDYKYGARPPVMTRFRKTKMRGAVMEQAWEGVQKEVFSRSWGTQEVLVAEAVDGAVDEESDDEDDEDYEDVDDEHVDGGSAVASPGEGTGGARVVGALGDARHDGASSGAGAVHARQADRPNVPPLRPGGVPGGRARPAISFVAGPPQGARAAGGPGGRGLLSSQRSGSFTLDSMGTGSYGSSLIIPSAEASISPSREEHSGDE